MHYGTYPVISNYIKHFGGSEVSVTDPDATFERKRAHI